MLTKNKIKFVRSLRSKKERYSHNCFVIEGEKIVQEALNSNFEVDDVYALDSFDLSNDNIAMSLASKKEMDAMSGLKQAPGILAVAKFKNWGPIDLNKGKYILLDTLNDPGNLGTIIRIADWFAFDGIICSTTSVDVYNQKVVQSSMGSLFRVPVWYADLKNVIEESPLPCIAAVMKGEDFRGFSFPKSGLLLLGSESHGVSDELLSLIDSPVTIPRLGKAESLNVSVAAGILCQAFS